MTTATPQHPDRRPDSAQLILIALDVMRRGPRLSAPLIFSRDVDYAEIPPAHVVAHTPTP